MTQTVQTTHQRGRRGLARAARIFTAVIAATVVGVGTASAAAAVDITTDYHPTQVSRDFGASVGGWTETESHTGLVCIEGLTCVAVSSGHETTGGAGGVGDGFLRTTVGPTLAAVTDFARATWTSPTFVYQGAGGYAPDSVSFTMDRRVDAGTLLALLTNKEYRVVLHNVTKDTNLEVLDRSLTNQPTWVPVAADPINPTDLVVGDTYEIRVITEFDAVAQVLTGGTFDYDNVRLRATATDTDGDGVPDSTDNCDTVVNPNQVDSDGDGIGNACDTTPNGPNGPDTDGDGDPDTIDNCDTVPNPNQSDKDKDGIGDACDTTPNGPDTDGDGVPNATDNCVNTPNAGQSDKDGDGIGDVCDTTANGAVTAKCLGAQALVQDGFATGETLRGTSGRDLLRGKQGNDRLLGLGGNDCLKGGSGNDTLRGQAGKDIVSGNAGRDVLTGQGGNDRVRGQKGNDKVRGGLDNDKLNGGTGKDKLNGGSGTDLVLGGKDADRLTGGKGKDTLQGGQGNDRVLAFDGKVDVIRCGGGADKVVADAKDKVAASCEVVVVRS